MGHNDKISSGLYTYDKLLPLNYQIRCQDHLINSIANKLNSHEFLDRKSQNWAIPRLVGFLLYLPWGPTDYQQHWFLDLLPELRGIRSSVDLSVSVSCADGMRGTFGLPAYWGLNLQYLLVAKEKYHFSATHLYH